MTDNTGTLTIPKKNIIIILVAVLVYALLFVGIVFAIDKSHYVSGNISTEFLSTWKVAGIVLSLYTLTTPWRWQKKLNSLTTQQNVSARQIWGVLILFCFVPFIAPLIYGLVLFFQGLSIFEFYYFVALSVVGALIWVGYNLRKNS